MSESSGLILDSWFSFSDTSSKEISPWSLSLSSEVDASTSGWADWESSAKSSFETWIFSGVLLALLEGNIGVPLFEISPLYKFSKSSPISSSASVPSSTCSMCFLNL